jgi:hypothetical protein
MIKKLAVVVCVMISSLPVFSQSPRNVIVEHFTNTLCSICAARNPGFYNELSGYPQVIHIAFHPSAPYSACAFSQQNITENDARTQYYNAYGSTPRIALQGTILPAANPLIAPGYIDAFLGQTAPMEVTINQQEITNDSIRVTIDINTTDNNNLPQQLLLFAGITQDTIFYNAPNGENLHHDVFRKALTQATGDLFSKPNNGSVATISFTYKINPIWVKERLRIIAFLQRSDTKEIINANTSNALPAGVINGIDDLLENDFVVYPNPVTDEVNIRSNEALGVIEIYNANGQLVISEYAGQQIQRAISLSNMPKGIYLLKLSNGQTRKLLRQ